MTILPSTRFLRDPWAQNLVAGICTGLSAGVFVALNLLGAGGGRPDSAHVVQMANATLSSVWFLASCFGGSFLNLLGPGPTMSIGVFTYALYVGALWYFEEVGGEIFPIVSGAIIGVGAGMVFITAGYIQTVYPEEKEKGKYIAAQNNAQALGSVVCSILPVIINRNNNAAAGTPRSIYIAFIVIMSCAGILALSLLPPEKLRRKDGSVVAFDNLRGPWTELKANLLIFTDWKLMIMLPAFLPAGSFLIYSGSVNAFHNDLRARSLLSFMAVLIQIPCGMLLHLLLDYKSWPRRKRALVGLTAVAFPLMIAWTWEMIRVRYYNRKLPPIIPLDWSDPEFGWIFVLFVLTWVSSCLWQYIVPYFIGALSNSPVKLTHYMGVYRGFLAAGEAICFGLDSIKIPYLKFAGGIFAFYIVGVLVLYYLGSVHINETNYFESDEEGVVVPNLILEEKQQLAMVEAQLAKTSAEVSVLESRA